MRASCILTAGIALMLSALPGACQVGASGAYSHFVSGDASAAPPSSPSPGLMLMGGGGWSREAWRWFANKTGNGHLVILRASQDGSDGDWILDEIGGIASVQTFVFHDRRAAFDPRVERALAHADGIFIAGGDQSKYVRFWKDTPVEAAVNAHVEQGRPLGGTSAGLAILGATGYGALAEEAVDSAEALSDPHGPKVTLVREFLDMPFLEHVITDTHFSERDRLGRLIAFIAQTRATADPDAIGLGVDEDSVIIVEADGTGRLLTESDGHAWLVQPVGMASFGPDGALSWDQVRITGIGTASVIDLTTMEVRDPAFSGTARVGDGRLANVPSPG